MKGKSFEVVYRSINKNYTLDEINSKIIREVCKTYTDKKYTEIKITLSSSSGLKEMISKSFSTKVDLGDVFDIARDLSMLITYFMSVSQAVRASKFEEVSLSDFNINFKEEKINNIIDKTYRELKETYTLTIRTR